MSSKPLAALYTVSVIVFMLMLCLHCNAGITVHRRAHTDSERPTEEVQSIEMEVELQTLPTSVQVQTDTEATEAHTSPKAVNPAVELTLIRRTFVDKVRLVYVAVWVFIFILA